MTPIGAASRVLRSDRDRGSAIPDSGISRWELEQDWADSWGSNAATAVGDPQFTTTAQVGSYAADFDGVDDYGDVGDVSAFEGLSEFSVSIWVYPRTVSSQQNAICKADGSAGTDIWSVWVMDDGTTRADFFDSAGNDFRPQGGSLSVDSYQMLTATYGPSEAVVYVDDSRVTSVSTNGNSLRTSSAIVAMAAWGGDDFFLDGILDDPRTYGKQLSDSEVSNLYNNGSI